MVSIRKILDIADMKPTGAVMHLTVIETLDAPIAQLDAEIAKAVRPFRGIVVEESSSDSTKFPD